MILVDTSVWIDHLRGTEKDLARRLEDEEVFTHPFVMGELAAGNLRNRGGILALLGALPESRVAGHEEVMSLLDARRLYGKGLGWVDLHLLAAALLTGCRLWTRDKPLREAARALKVEYATR